MQLSSRSAVRLLAVTSLLIPLLTVPAGASPVPPRYTITDLGTLGGSDSDGISVNEAGQVVGSANLADGSTHAFLWAAGKIQDLGPSGNDPSQALYINNHGVIVGWASDTTGAQKPALWTEGLFQDLSPGGPWGVADTLNDFDQIVGHISGGGTMWTDGVAQSLFPGPVGCINNAGNWAEYTDAAAYLKDGTLLSAMAYPTNMNEKGEVVGLLRASPGHQAVLWSGGQTIRLGTLGGAESVAGDINDASLIVGEAQTPAGVYHAFLYNSSEGLVDLNSRIDSAQGWELQYARSINAAGQITGTGVINGHNHAYLLTPLPSVGTGAWAQVDRSSVAFGSVVIGASSVAKSVRLTNAGDAPLTIGTVGIAGGAPGDFAVSGGAGVTVSPGGSTLLTITFSPTAAGARSAYLIIASNAYYSPTTVTLVGTGKVGTPPAPRYTITDLGTLGGADSVGSGINDLGQVAGNATLADGSRHAFLWTAGKMQDLGTLGGNQSDAIRLNNHGVVAGLAHTAADVRKPVIWTNGVIQDLSPGGDWGVAYGINDAGQITGHIGGQGMLWTDGVAQSLPFTVGGALNDAGQVAGYTDSTAFLWTNGTSQPIFTYAYTTAMNDAGQVVGYYRASPGHLAALWDGSQGVSLGTLGGTESQAWDINAAGQIVGQAQTGTGTWHAFLREPGRMIDLNSGIDAGLGWELTDAHGINAIGQITGQGTIHGQNHAFLLTPLPVPSIGHVHLDASALDFGSATVNTNSAARTVTVTNSGDAALAIGTVSLSGPNAGDFAVTGGAGTSVPAGGTTTLSVTFTPSGLGSRSASLVIASNGDNSPTTVTLAGSGVSAAPGGPITPPVFDPANGHWYQAVRVPAGIDWHGAKSAAAALSYAGSAGHLATLTSAAETQFVSTSVVNTAGGSETFWLGAYQDRTAPDFSEPAGGWRWVTGEPFSYTYWSAGEPNNMNVAGNEDALQLVRPRGDQWNDQYEWTPLDGYLVEYEPTGAGGAGGSAHVQVDASTLDFGAVAVGVSSTPRNVTITNTGGVPLSITALSLAAANPEDFTVTGGMGVTVLPAGTTTLSVTFRPTAAGTRSATLVMTSNGDNSPTNVTLTGIGAVPGASPYALLVGSRNGNSVLRYDGASGAFVDAFVPAGSGGLSNTQGMALGPDGNLYVVSTITGNVLQFDGQTGAFLRVFATALGLDPSGMTFGPDGNLYVCSHTTHNVYRFNGQTGSFIDIFASGGGLTYPVGVTFGPDGNLYVGAYHSNQIIRFNGLTGAPIDTFVAAGSGGLDQPTGMTFGPDGDLYVSSLNSNNVLRYNGRTGAFIDAFAAGSGLTAPIGLAFGPDGNLYVCNSGTDSVLRFNGQTGAFLDTFVSSGSGGLSGPHLGLIFAPITVAPPGPNPPGAGASGHLQLDASTLDFGSMAVGATSAARSVTVTNTGGAPLLISSVSLAAANPGDFAVTGGTGVTVPAGGTTTVAVTFKPTIAGSRSAFVIIASNADNSPATLTLTGTGVAPAPSAPRLLVVSENTASILRYDGTTGAFIDPLVPSGSGGLTDPGAFTIGPDGNLYVSTAQRILKYDGQTGSFLGVFAASPDMHPVGLAFGADGNLYVANHDAGNVLRLNGQTGASMGVFASGGGLTYSATVLFGPDGNLYVSSWHGNEIVRFNGQTGALIDVFVPPGSGGLDHPNGFTFGPDGNLYVCSFYTNAILRYSGQTGAFLGIFASAGGLSGPLGLAFGPDGNLYVSSHNTDSVLRYDGRTGAYIDAFIPSGSGGLSGPHVGLIFTPAAGSSLPADPQLRVDATALDFGSVALNTASTARSVNITNTGGAPLQISTVGLTGASAGDFAVTGGNGASLSPGQTTSLSITFTPKASGSRSATLVITSNADNSPTTVALTGTGIVPLPPYRIVDLGTLGGDLSAGFGVNSAGEVVGMSYLTGNVAGSDGGPATHAVLFSHGQTKDLGTLGGSSSQARDINDAGQIVGTAMLADGTSHAFLYSGGTMQDLGTLGGKSSEGDGINDRGQVVGRAETAAGDVHAYLYSDGVMHDLGALPDAPFSAAYHINHAGQIAGFAFQPTGQPPSYAILVDGGVMQKLNGVSGGTATDINAAGQVVGQSGGHAFLSTNGVLADLGTLAPGDAWSESLGVNNLGQVVGTSGSAPFLYSMGAMTNLNSLISGELGWNLAEAWAVNDAGQIAGTGVIHGQRHAFLLTPVSVPVIGPRLQVDAGSLDFGSVTINTAGAAQSVKLTNTGDAPLHISTIDLAGADAGDFGVTGGAGAAVAAGGSLTLAVAFTPSAAGSRSATLLIASDATLSPTPITLTGAGSLPVAPPHPVASISPLQVDFGSQPVGTSNGAQVFLLQNTGTAPLTIANIALAGADVADFTVLADGWSGTQLAPGQVATLSVRFTPTATGSRSANLVVTDDAASSPQLIPLTGTGTAAMATLSIDTLSFTDQLVGTASAEQTVTLTNTGAARLILGGVSLAGANSADFVAVIDPGTLALAPGESRTIHVRFRPTVAGSRAAALQVTDSAAGSPQSVALTGTGTAPSVSFGISRLSGPGTISFGSVALGTASATQTLTLTNSGTAPLTIGSAALSGANAADYRVTADSGGATLPPGGSRTFTLRFTPLALGGRRAALTITDNIPGGPQTVALDGTGILSPSGSAGKAAIPTGLSVVLDSVDGAPVQSQNLGPNKVLVVTPGQHVTVKLLAKFANGAVADVTADPNAHLGLSVTVGQFTAKNVWMARPADAGRLVTFYGSYRSLAGGRPLTGTVKLSVLPNRRRK